MAALRLPRPIYRLPVKPNTEHPRFYHLKAYDTPQDQGGLNVYNNVGNSILVS